MKFQNATPVSPDAIRPFRFQSGCVVFDRESSERYHGTFLSCRIPCPYLLKIHLDTRNLTTESGDKLYAQFDTRTFLKLIFIKFSRNEMHSCACARDAHSKLADLTIIIHDSKLWLRIQVYTQNCNRYNSESRFPSMTFPLFVNSISFLSVLFRYLHTYQTILDTSVHVLLVYSMPRDTFQIEFSRDPFTWCIYARPIIISHFDKCKRIDPTRDDPLSIDKVPLIIMTDWRFLLVKRQEHHRPACLRSISPLLVPGVCLTVTWNLMAVSSSMSRWIPLFNVNK